MTESSFDARGYHQKPVQVFQDFKEYSAGFGCKGICEYSELVTKTSRKRGSTAQEQGFGYCRKCGKHWKPESGLRCPCCNVILSRRIRSKQSRGFREKQREVVSEVKRLSCTLNRLCSRTVHREEKPIYRIFDGKE